MLNKAMKNTIKLLAADVEVGAQSDLIECPFCHGGMTKEESFTIKPTTNGILYICYRASCDERGFIPSVRITYDYTQEKPVEKLREPNPFYGEIADLTDEDCSILLNKFPTLKLDTLISEGVKYSPPFSRVLYPCYDYRGYRYAWNARRYTEFSETANGKKSILYFDTMDVHVMHFPVGFKNTGSVLLVEDQVSAIIANQMMPSIALLGTNLSERDAHHLHELGITRVKVALDDDATKKAIQLKKQFSLAFDEFTVIPLRKDIKDMNDIEFARLRRQLLGKESS